MLKKLVIIIPVLVFFFVALAFGAQNSSQVSVNFLFVQAQLSIAAVAAIFLALGFSAAFVFYIWASLRWRLRYKRLLSRLNRAE